MMKKMTKKMTKKFQRILLFRHNIHNLIQYKKILYFVEKKRKT
jgi:hypothetical protein